MIFSDHKHSQKDIWLKFLWIISERNLLFAKDIDLEGRHFQLRVVFSGNNFVIMVFAVKYYYQNNRVHKDNQKASGYQQAIS